MSILLCNCYHSKADHHLITKGGESLRTWCIYSEIGQCPCDCYQAMENLQYLEWKEQLAHGI